MKSARIALYAASLGLLAAIAGCEEQHGAVSKNNVAQTGFPGQVTAGGGTSGEVLSQVGQATQGVYRGGTPGIAGGSGGNTGGAATGGTVTESGNAPGGGGTPAPSTAPSGASSTAPSATPAKAPEAASKDAQPGANK